MSTLLFFRNSSAKSSRIYYHARQSLFFTVTNRKYCTVNPDQILVRRAMLYTPGDNAKMMRKSATLPVDSICLDLEDAIASSSKHVARKTVASILPSIMQMNLTKDVLVRINPVGSGYEEDDIAAILESPNLPDGIVLPKVDSVDHINWLDNRIKMHAQTSKQQVANNIRVTIMMESAISLLSLRDICGCPAARRRVEAIIFGADDYAADIGANRSESNKEVLMARQWTVAVAKAFGLAAIDIVHIGYDTNSLETLKAESKEGFNMGYTGKQIIHPAQIEPTQIGYTPDIQYVKWAKKILEGYKKSKESGDGVFSFEGKMIDAPTIKRAMHVMKVYEASK